MILNPTPRLREKLLNRSASTAPTKSVDAPYFDVAAFHFGTDKVKAIIKPTSLIRGNPRARFLVELENGSQAYATALRISDRRTKSLMKTFKAEIIPFVAEALAKSAPEAAPVDPSYIRRPGDGASAAELAQATQAAANLNRLFNETKNAFHDRFFAMDAIERARVLRPLVNASPIPLNASVGNRIFHLRQLLRAHAGDPALQPYSGPLPSFRTEAISAAAAPAPAQIDPLNFEALWEAMSAEGKADWCNNKAGYLATMRYQHRNELRYSDAVSRGQAYEAKLRANHPRMEAECARQERLHASRNSNH